MILARDAYPDRRFSADVRSAATFRLLKSRPNRQSKEDELIRMAGLCAIENIFSIAQRGSIEPLPHRATAALRALKVCLNPAGHPCETICSLKSFRALLLDGR